MSIIHILNIADWALIGAGLAAALVMMVVGSDGEQRSGGKAPRSPNRRRGDLP
jgi:hypothetical protein